MQLSSQKRLIVRGFDLSCYGQVWRVGGHELDANAWNAEGKVCCQKNTNYFTSSDPHHVANHDEDHRETSLAFYLTYILAYFLASILAICLAYTLTYVLPCCLTKYLSNSLAFYLAVEVQRRPLRSDPCS